MKKQSIAIVGVIALILAVAVGYALFSETITINGTATAKGDFDVEFTEVGDVVNSEGYTNVEGNELATISNDKNSLNISVKNLDYPGAYVEIPVTITNKGSIAAELESINQTGLDGESTPIRVTYSGIAASETPIASGETQDMVVRVEWLEDNNETAENAEFTISLNYKQAQ